MTERVRGLMRGALRGALVLGVLALVAPSSAAAARFAVGVDPGASLTQLAATIETTTDGSVTSGDVGLRALFVDAPAAGELGALPGVEYVERVDNAKRRLAFTPNDPLVGRQWYLNQIRAFDAWPQLPTLPRVLVAVLDSGIDARHPDLAGRIAATKSFIGGSASEDRRGHGTFVAGEIAAATGNATGIAGIAFPGQLLVAKIARADGTIPLEAEARAIRWAVDRGARVINLSLAGVRHPFRLGQDTYSRLEASAVAYARRRGALVVAAVGNSDQAPKTPWNYAGYPAALPHVLGVSALERDGSVSRFSNRDVIYNDLAAPGEDIFSTLPRALSTSRACANPGYSDCGPYEYRRAEGTSFAAPQAAAAAALLLSLRPALAPNQLAWLLERSAVDATPGTGCKSCRSSRDRYTGWGRLDVTGAVFELTNGALPRPDRYEANDDAGALAWPLRWRRGTLTAMIDFWDDQADVYRIRLKRGQRFSAVLHGPAGTDTDLLLWKPGTRTTRGLAGSSRRLATRATGPGAREHIRRYIARRSGSYYLEVRISRAGSGPYSLSISKS